MVAKEDNPENEGLFETVGKTADMIGKTSVGKKIGTIFSVMLLALLSGGANMTIIDDYLNPEPAGPIGGCMNHAAVNYAPQATFDDGSCYFSQVIYGCTNSTAENYNEAATHDNGHCIYPDNNNNETVDEPVEGCTDPEAENYDSKAEEDDGSCEYEDDPEPEPEPDCQVEDLAFYPGWQDEDGNSTEYDIRNDSHYPLHLVVDIDTDCGDETIETLLYFDAASYATDEVFYKDYYFNVTGSEWDAFNLTMNETELNNTAGLYEIYVSLFADLDGDGEYDYYDYFYIEEIEVMFNDEEEEEDE